MRAWVTTELRQCRELVSNFRTTLARSAPLCAVITLGLLSLGVKARSEPYFLLGAEQPASNLERSLPPIDKRFALLIAAGSFQRPVIKPLQGPENDILLMKQALTSRGLFFDRNVIVLNSGSSDKDNRATVGNIREVLNRELQDKVAGGLLFVEYSGHGFAKDGVPYLLTWDSVLGSQDNLDEQALRVSKLMGMLRTVHASQIILLVDACQDDPDASHSLTDNPMTPEFRQGFNTELQGDLKASLIFFATRPPRRAYINDHNQGYFTAAAVDVLTKSATSSDATTITLKKFISTITESVSNDTGQRQIPEALPPKGYDVAAVKITASPTLSSAHDGSWHRVKFRYTGTESACAPLPSNAKLLVTTGAAIETVDGPFGCEVPYRLARSAEGDTVHLNLANASSIVVDTSKQAYNAANELWTIDVHSGGVPLRISTFDGGDVDETRNKYDYLKNLSERSVILAGLLAVNSETRYTSGLSVVPAGTQLPDSLDHQLEYLRKTNSLELVSISTRVSPSGPPLLRLRALMAAKESPGYRQLSVEIPISDANYPKIFQVENVLMLEGLLESARVEGYRQAQAIILNELQLEVQQIGDLTGGLEQLRMTALSEP